MLWVVGAVSILILSRLRNVIRARGQDVHYWQKQLIKSEYEIDSEKYFTKFKVTQILKHDRNSPAANLIDLDSLGEEQEKYSLKRVMQE